MEMSRQRLRTGVLEASTTACPHCDGTGLMRTAASAGLSALRMIEDEAARARGDKLMLRAGLDAAVYVLNKKRSELAEIENRYGVSIDIAIDESFEGAKMTVDSSGPRPERVQLPKAAEPDTAADEEEEELEAALVGVDAEEEDDAEEREERDERPGRRRRRRRRGGRGRRRGQDPADSAGEMPDSVEGARTSEDDERAKEPAAEESKAEADEKPKKSRRRRKKTEETSKVEPDSSPMVSRPTDEEPPIAETEAPAEPQPKARRPRKKKAEVPEPAPSEAAPAETSGEKEAEAKPKRRTRKAKASARPAEKETEKAGSTIAPAADNDPNGGEASGEPRRGWWQRTFG
jgi:ribonuclease E